jgi:hypothetical protein
MRIDAAIIGAHKCGTTALLETLLQHPQLMSHPTGQWPYFLREDDYREQYPEVLRTYFGAHDPTRKVIVRDTSLYLEPEALARLDELSPGVRPILIIKEPVERAYSAYCYARSRGFDADEDFGRIIEEQADGPYLRDRPPICSYVRMGMYHRNLEAIRQVIPRERICILLAADLKRDPVATCNAVFRFLRVPELDVHPVIVNQTRKTRSGQLEVMMKRDTPAKRVLKALLPLPARLHIRRSLSRLNTTSHRFPPISEQHSTALHAIFAEETRRLAADYGIDFTAAAGAERVARPAGQGTP